MTDPEYPASDSGAQEPELEPSLWPTRKWWAVAISGVFTILAHAVGSGAWDAVESAELLTLAAGLSSSYLTPNHQTTGGVPETAKKRRRGATGAQWPLGRRLDKVKS